MAKPRRENPRNQAFRARMGRERKNPELRNPRRFDYTLNYRRLDLRAHPEYYRVGVGEQGVLLVEPYKSEILPHWKFRTPEEARKSATQIRSLFLRYRRAGDLVGMDMARKFLQMGYTRSRRYANHSTGRKYNDQGKMLPFRNDPVKAESARIFFAAWKAVEADPDYASLKTEWKRRYG